MDVFSYSLVSSFSAVDFEFEVGKEGRDFGGSQPTFALMGELTSKVGTRAANGTEAGARAEVGVGVGAHDFR